MPHSQYLLAYAVLPLLTVDESLGEQWAASRAA